MNPKKHYLLAAVFVTAGTPLFAQRPVPATNPSASVTQRYVQPDEKSPEQRNYNFIKLNLAGLAVKNYSIQLERTLGKKFSAAVSIRTMPNTSIPFRSQISKAVGDSDPNTKDLIDHLELSNFAVTPEFRMYLGKKGYGRGFYVAPFYRYASFKTNTLRVDFTGENGEKSLNLSGNLNTNTAGILFGAQWALGSHMCLDWWIAGPHYGFGHGDFSGVSSQPLTQREQDELYRQIDGLDIPFTDKEVHVNAGGATLKLNGPWAGVRAGLSLGVRF